MNLRLLLTLHAYVTAVVSGPGTVVRVAVKAGHEVCDASALLPFTVRCCSLGWRRAPGGRQKSGSGGLVGRNSIFRASQVFDLSFAFLPCLLSVCLYSYALRGFVFPNASKIGFDEVGLGNWVDISK